MLNDEVRADRTAVAELLDPHWRKIAASGRSGHARRSWPSGPRGQVEFDLVGTRELAKDTILLLYRSHDQAGIPLRTSIWQRDPSGRWLQVFHQGTLEI